VLELKRDPTKPRLLCAAKLITAINQCALSTPNSLASVAVINSTPQSINTLAGRVQFNIDARATDDETLAKLEAKFERECKRIAEESGVRIEKWERIWKCPRVFFDEKAIDCFRKSTADVCGTVREMQSGAGHDSVYTSKIVPTAMLFIRCKGGESVMRSFACACIITPLPTRPTPEQASRTIRPSIRRQKTCASVTPRTASLGQS
jgi:metal-dependent amidase/aminoacylase/carboxypeptidase family protein